jgi:ribosomal 30S subunit maturation factor RimM|tara:strand:- start:397 stop:609 length:213 start_codon:yes stop_codon:yes gene_type:complete
MELKQPKFSAFVEELSAVWWQWMKNDIICRDETISYKERKKAAQECEVLIDSKYKIIEKMDNFFDEKRTT